ncbi:MAG: thymidine kinase [Candidatus Nanohalobium sp.]
MSSVRIPSDGHIEVITGSMFSGKTEELIRRITRAELAGQKVQVYKPEIDDRYSETEIGSHDGRSWEAQVIASDDMESLKEAEADVIAVDEANFFEENLVEASDELADSGKRVIISGIDQNFRGEPFRPLPELMAAAEYVEKLRAICARCGKPATRNQRLIDGEPAHVDDPEVMVGAKESYEARCRDCHELRTD